MTLLAKVLAIVGGSVLCCLIAITCLSVFGRFLNTLGHTAFIAEYLQFLERSLQGFGPINGDYELVEAGVAFAIFCFLPWCQLKRGHASVELLSSVLPRSIDRLLTFLWELLFAAVLVLLTWRLGIGMGDKMRYEETTFLLQMPIWWAYAACLFAGVIASLIAVYSSWLRLQELAGARKPDSVVEGVQH